jgi:hypothetical protein
VVAVNITKFFLEMFTDGNKISTVATLEKRKIFCPTGIRVPEHSAPSPVALPIVLASVDGNALFLFKKQ